jgi:hypothetical protein
MRDFGAVAGLIGLIGWGLVHVGHVDVVALVARIMGA